jgi:hypothetical protein
MAEYEITGVIWHERNDQIYVTYVEEEPDHMVSTQQVASDLARDAGLSPVAAPRGIRRWVRTPESKAGAKDEAPMIDPRASTGATLEASAAPSLWVTLPTRAEG